MIPQNILSLIQAVIDKTDRKKAIWGKTARPEEFKLSLENGAITVDSWNDGDNPLCDFAIYNKFGDRIENYMASFGSSDYDIIISLHGVARREFYKVDETIDGMSKEIRDTQSVGVRQIENSDDLPF